MSGKYKNLDETINTDNNCYLKTRHQPLLEYLCNATATNINGTNNRKLYSLCLLVEHIEGLRNQNYVCPFAFAQSLVKWNFSASKVSHSLDSCSYSSGSITTLKTFFKEISALPNTCNMIDDIEVFADNTQKKGRTSRVKENATTPIAIATNVIL